MARSGNGSRRGGLRGEDGGIGIATLVAPPRIGRLAGRVAAEHEQHRLLFGRAVGQGFQGRTEFRLFTVRELAVEIGLEKY